MRLVIITWTLAALCFISAISVVWISYETRFLTEQLGKLVDETNELKIRKGQLVLEVESKLSHAHLERFAKQHGLVSPRNRDIKSVSP